MNGWKTLTDMVVNAESIRLIEGYCSELLIHAADVEGLCQGIDEELVKCELEYELWRAGSWEATRSCKTLEWHPPWHHSTVSPPPLLHS
jgi:hypothetical protein